MQYKYLFGPVISRRFGRSLGIDLLSFKTCSLDCVYCECGKTTNLTIKRKEYVPTTAVIKELDDFLSQKPALDCVTFSGSGEPTLHSGIGKIIRFIKSKYSRYKTVLLTNGTLLGQASVRKSILRLDIIKVSVDAVSSGAFAGANRPHKSLSVEKLINGILKLKKEFRGQLWLEIFIVPGINDSKQELEKLKNMLAEIKPDKVQINSLDRPGAERWVRPVSKARINQISKYLFAETASISSFSCPSFHHPENMYEERNLQSQILAAIKRRPCTADDLSKMSGVPVKQVIKYLLKLVKKNIISRKKQKRGIFYGCH